MTIYEIKYQKQLKRIKEKPFKLERDIQLLTENNLDMLFGLEFVKSEFTIQESRIDTLAYDIESNTFVIIEYKKRKNFSVVDQGYSYLSLMLNNKADFILEYNENLKSRLERRDVDWSQSKIIFIAPSFTHYQKQSINFKDLPIELWEVKRYSNKTINFYQVKPSIAQESIKTISPKNQSMDKVRREIRVFTEEDHLKRGSEKTKELYETYKQAIINLDDIEVKPKKKYLAFVSESNIVDIHIQKRALKLWINLNQGELDDPKGIARDVSNIGHWGNGDYEIRITSDEDLEYILSLIKQSLKQNSNVDVNC